MQLSSSDIFNEIKLYKNKITVKSTELEHFLKYLDDTVFNHYHFFCNPNKGTVAPSFLRAFKTLTDKQQANYYLACLKIVYELSSKKELVEEPSESKREKLELLIKMQNKQWRKTSTTIFFKPAIIEIEYLDSKLKMENYILRMSKTNKKHAFVLESTKGECSPETIRLGATQLPDFNEIITKIKEVVYTGLKQVITKKMRLSKDSRQFVDNWLQVRQCMSMELKDKPIPQGHQSLKNYLKPASYDKLKNSRPSRQSIEKSVTQQLIQNHLIESLDHFEDFTYAEKGFFVHNSLPKIKKSCLFDSKFFSLQWVAQQIMAHDHFKLWKKSLHSIFVIGDIQSQNTRFYHEIDLYQQGQQVDFVYMRHKFEKEGIIYVIDKSISTAEYDSHETSGSRGKIEHCLWRIKNTPQHFIEIIVEAEISHLPCQDVFQAMNEQIGELENIPECLNAGEALINKKMNPRISFFSVSDDEMSPETNEKEKDNKDVNLSVFNESEFYSINNRESAFYSMSRISVTPPEQVTPSLQTYHYQIHPIPSKEQKFRPFFKGCVFDPDQCVTNPKGDLVFTNKEKIKAQGGVILSLLRKMGTNLFTGKNVLNVSFPIDIFAPDTNLERLCKGLAYAPHFLENKTKQTPLQKIKAAICFAIGNLLLYIDMAKPFNPILGETYQAFIDGCPVYGEQTCHHPPISSVYLEGRDYLVSASIEATVELGLNSVSGTNSGEYRVIFDKANPKGNTVIFTSPPGELKGVIYGQRKLNITGTSRFFDPDNMIFCEIQWGSKKTKNPVSRYHDYLEGTVVELSKVPASIDKVKVKETDSILGYITGRWTQTIFFDDQPIFQINKLQPYLVTEEKVPLQSDSRFRMDRVYVERGKLVDAQSAKQKLEEIQRRDRKLRKEYHR